MENFPCVCFFHVIKITTSISEACFMQLYNPTPQVCISRVLGAAATNEMGFRNTKTVSRLQSYRKFPSCGIRFTKKRQSDYHSKTDKKNYMRGGMCMGRPKSRQTPRTTMTIRVSERERRQIEVWHDIWTMEDMT